METTFKSALEHALKVTGRSLRAVAMSADVSYDQLKSLRQGKSQRTNVDDAVKVAKAFGVTLEEFYAGSLDGKPRVIAVAGKVGAGARVDLVDAYAKGAGDYHVLCPTQLQPTNIVAVEVAGDSMEPVYSEGDLLFYTRISHDGVPSEAIGKKCVVEDTAGNAWVKYLKAGEQPGTFSLISLNTTGANMHDVKLAWAAPVRLHLPSDLVEKVP